MSLSLPRLTGVGLLTVGTLLLASLTADQNTWFFCRLDYVKENGEEERNNKDHQLYLVFVMGPESQPKLTKVAYPLLGSNQCIQAWTVTLMDVLPYAWQHQE